MNSKIKKIKPFLRKWLSNKAGKASGLISYSQCAEDILADFFFDRLQITKPTYLDIGANEPIHFSNTYRLYLKGGKGVCVEPNLALVDKFHKIRPKDTVLSAGVSVDGVRGEMNYFMMNWHEFNTFSEERAKEVESHYQGRNNIIAVKKVPIVPIEDIISNYFSHDGPDFLSIDVEGLDLEILKQWNFSMFRPKLCCVETHSDSDKMYRNTVIKWFQNQSYSIYSQTPINTLFCDDLVKF